MADNLLTETLESNPNTLENAADEGLDSARPPHVPEKFWDPATGSIRVESLLKSYLELERKLSSGQSSPDREALLKMIGVPVTADEYCIRCDHGLFESDATINQRMHELGFTPEQAQFVYDLGAERMVPLVQEMAAQFQAEREIERLKNHFGGEEKWRDMARQILAWARQNLPDAAVAGMSTTYDGVMALYGMMTHGGEASTFGRQSTPAEDNDPSLLMKDPRYWRDRDPAFIAKVTEGFERRYGKED